MDGETVSWQEDQEWERNWWGSAVNTLREELLQIEYARRMGLVFTPTDRTPYNIDMGGKSVLDIGGGPCSLLLKCVNLRGVVVDPCEYPEWTVARYDAAGIDSFTVKFEHFDACTADESWIYNVLQHTSDPSMCIKNARRLTKTIRIFEFIDAGISPGHPHNLIEAQLNEWLGGKGTVEDFREHGAVGKVYYGVFET